MNANGVNETYSVTRRLICISDMLAKKNAQYFFKV